MYLDLMTATALLPGSVVHVGTDLRYVGKFTVETVDAATQTVSITNGVSRGRAAFDQLFATRAEAQANAKAMSSGSLAALGGNRVARRLAR